jgi:predicted alpha/beta superfamily hydrolase
MLTAGMPGIEAAQEADAPHRSAQVGLRAVSMEPIRRMRGEDSQWDYEIHIALPPSYEQGDRTYPVLWVTDGHVYFDAAAEIASSREGKALPEMIVVGIGTPPDEMREAQMRRAYDFSSHPVMGFEGFGADLFDAQRRVIEARMQARGLVVPVKRGGAPAFLAFLVDRVRSELARDYRMSADHTLFGHSGGGLFCTYALLSRPEAFDKYICSSPNLNAGNQEIFRLEQHYAETHENLRAKVFFGAGEGEVLEGEWISAWGIVSSMTRMAEILRLRPYASLQLHVRVFPDAGHLQAGLMSLRWGLRTLWSSETRTMAPGASR